MHVHGKGRIDHPGITALDVGLATAIEKLWEQCVDDGQVRPANVRPTIVPATTKTDGRKMHVHMLSVTALKLGYIGGNVTCLACGEAHMIQDCPTRHTTRPPHPCLNCGGWHWMQECPLGNAQKPSRKRKQSTPTAPSSLSSSASSPSPPSPSPTLVSHADAELRETDSDSARRMESTSA